MYRAFKIYCQEQDKPLGFPLSFLFQLNFPSGARVKFVYMNPSSDIIVSLPPDDYQNSTGLCGTWNGERDDDFTNADGQVIRPIPGTWVGDLRNKERMDNFTESWR